MNCPIRIVKISFNLRCCYYSYYNIQGLSSPKKNIFISPPSSLLTAFATSFSLLTFLFIFFLCFPFWHFEKFLYCTYKYISIHKSNTYLPVLCCRVETTPCSLFIHVLFAVDLGVGFLQVLHRYSKLVALNLPQYILVKP